MKEEITVIKKEKIMDELKVIFWEIAGSLLMAIGLYNFAVNAEFPVAGFSGIAIILYRLFHVPIGVSTILLNIPVALACYRLLGKRFFFRSFRCMLISSVFIDVIAPLFPSYAGSRLLAAVCAGVFSGLGYAAIYMHNSSTGGADFIIMAVKALKPHLSVGNIIFMSDFIIVLAGGILFRDMDGIIYGMIVNVLVSVVVDKVMYGANAGKLALIVTFRGEKVTEIIDETCDRGSTVLTAAGGYSGDEKQVVMCACSNKQMYTLQQAVQAADPDCFIIIMESNEVHGEGFRMIQIGEKQTGKKTGK